MSTTLSNHAPAPDGLEWWERQQFRRQRREAEQVDRAPVRARARAGLSWLAAAILLIVAVARPELRPGLRSFAGTFLLLVGWFALVRTRTLSWRSTLACFASAVVWAVLTAAGLLLTGHVGEVSVLALLLPVLAIAFPGRVRRFAASDWLLIGGTLGLGYQAVQKGALSISGPVTTGASGSGGWFLDFVLLGGSIGVGTVAFRQGARFSSGGQWMAAAWRVSGAVLPVLAFVALIGSSTGVKVAMLVALACTALLIDTRRLRMADEPGTDRLPYPFSPAAAADQWTLGITGPGEAGWTASGFLISGVWAACCLLTYSTRDVLLVLGAHLRDAGEPVSQARSRGRAAATLVRVMRAGAFRPLDQGDGEGRRTVRSAGTGAAVLLIVTGAVLEVAGDPAPVSRLSEAWTALGISLSLPGKLCAAVALIAALVLISGASGVGLTEQGTRRLRLDDGRGSVSFARPGPLAARVRTSTVAELVLDAVTTGISLIPPPVLAPLTRSATSGPSRAVVAEFCADPARMIARQRRRLAAAPDDTGAMMAVRTGNWDPASRRRWVDSRLGSRAYRITSADGRTSVQADGLSLASDGAVMLESTHLHRSGAAMLYQGDVPAVLAERLFTPFDDEMRRYATVIRDPHNPVTRLRLVVGSEPAAGVLGVRAREILGPDLDMLIIIDPVED